jgi:hypothetical protein
MIKLSDLMKNTRASMDITGVVVDVVLVMALIPIVATFISTAHACRLVFTVVNENLTTNATVCGLGSTEYVVLSLATLFIVLALVFSIVKQAGFGKKH